MRPVCLFAAVQDGRKRLIDQEAEHRIQCTFHEGKGQVKHQQAGKQAIDIGVDGLVHADDGIQRQMIHDHISRVNDEVVVRHRDDRHNQRAQQCADDGALAGLVALVDKARHTDEERAHHEVEQLAYRGGAGAGQLDEVFDEADEDARDRPIGEAGDQRGQLRHIQLDESGHDGDGKFQVHEHGGHSAKHGGTRKNADFAGRVLHNKMPPVKK